MSQKPIPFTPLVDSLPAAVPFVGPETLERMRGTPFDARIGANESAFGMSPKALAAVIEEAPRSAWYGDSVSWPLREALADHHGVDPEEILIGAGIDALLGNTVRMLARPGTQVVTSAGAYPTFNYHVAGFGADLMTIPYRNDAEDPEALLAKIQETGAPLAYFANPDNPMGTWYDAETIQNLIDRIPDGCVLILDEAYIDFAPDGTAPAIDASNPKLLRMRTFSKAHGMAGLRIGYTIAHKDLITGLNKVRNHFEINRLAQVAALASLQDLSFVQSVCEEVARGRQELYALAEGLGLKALPSATNFVAIDMGRDGAYARSVLKELDARGVFVRMPGVAPMDRCIRVTVGTAQDRKIFGERLAEVVASLS
ncbi:MAG: pyridoxal phosphate-dependent aminotransferase [Alphaproteobacteria bacterium]|nr:pyridoxal phosphate-dependent aminotransferase [Alphaproteobacteria bacterium]